MSNLKTLKARVEFILGRFPETRNSDTLLTVKLWEHFCHEKLANFGGEWFVKIDLVRALPREDHIKRIRASIQNVEKRHLPTDWNVAKQRKWSEVEWRAFLRDEQPSIPIRTPQFDHKQLEMTVDQALTDTGYKRTGPVEEDKSNGQSALLGGL